MKACASVVVAMAIAVMRSPAQEQEGNFGMRFSQHNGAGLVIGDVVANSPAAKAGLKAGYIITQVDGKSLANLEIGNARALLRGAAGTIARIEVTDPRDFEKTRIIEIARAKRQVPKALIGPRGALLAWSIPHEGEDPVAQFSAADESVEKKIGQTLGRERIPFYVDGGRTRTVHVPPSRVPKAKELLRIVRADGHESLKTLTSSNGSVTVDAP